MKTSFLILLAFSHFSLAAPLTRQENTTLNFPSASPEEGDYAVVNAFGNLSFNAPIAIASPEGDTSHVFVVERSGKLQRVNLANNTKTEFLDLRAWVLSQGWDLPTESEQGFLSVAFHPNYTQNGYFFVFYSVAISGQNHQRIARLTATGTPGNFLAATTCDPSTHVSLITQRDEATNHNGGDMHFASDGYLYISLGDEGKAHDFYNNGNFINKDFFSAILRIDVDQLPGNLLPNAHTQGNSTSHSSAVHPNTYKIPADNPFIGKTSHQGKTIAANSIRTEIWVTGLRNPWRFSFDPPTGRCFIGDVGQGKREEINLVAGGEDCGWSRREGTIAFTKGPEGSSVPAGYSPHEPIHTYPRNVGRSITGGLVYRGSRLGELFGKYLFADYRDGKLWSLTENGSTWTRSNISNLANISGFGEDPSNKDLLICRIVNGSIGRLVRNTTSNPAPQTLSETGAFSDLSNLTPEIGIYAYDVNHPFWSDHAGKSRWFSIPTLTDTMTYSAAGPWNFPTGQIWIKHFDLEMTRGNPATKRRIETRFLVKTISGSYGLSYRWRSDGSDADLVGPAGLQEEFTITDQGSTSKQIWHYPSRTNCTSCHTEDSNYVLAFHTRQLNRPGALGNDQIASLANAGFLNTTPEASAGLPAHPALDNLQVSREARIRSYLHVNCAMCHRGDTSLVPGNFDARITTQTDLAMLINGILINNLGNSNNRFLVPNDTAHSVVLKKLDGSAGRMPPLASTVIDQSAIDLMSAWITQDLPNRQSYDQWAQANFGETGTTHTEKIGDFDADGLSNFLEYLATTDPTSSASKFKFEITGNQFTFLHPANRSLLIETSSDLQTWTPLLNPNNSPLPPAHSLNQDFSFPEGKRSFIRAKFSAP